MKRMACCVLLTVLLVSVISLPCLALASEEDAVVTYYEDGSYLIERIVVTHSRASGTKTGAKEAIYYGSSGASKWKAVLNGTFSYTGSSATCTASSVSVTIYDSSWYTVSKSASKSGNTAYGSVTMGYKTFGVTVNEVSKNLSLKCDANGNLS